MYGRDELKRLLDWAAERDLFVIADEVYRRIWFREPPTSALEFTEHRDRVLCVDSLSKTYSACGLRPCREAAAAYHSRWSPGLGWEHVAVTTGGSEALLFAFTAICDPGDEILVPEPYYTNYNGFATVAGASICLLYTSDAADE